MQCKNCHKENSPEARFCGSCGAPLVATEEPSVAAVLEAVPTPPAVAMEYIGFGIRLGAAVIDSIFTLAAMGALRFLFLGAVTAFWINGFLPLLYWWLLTGLKGQTLGKMALGIKVVDKQGNIPGLGRAVLREILGKLVSIIVFYLGFLWIIWDKDKQGWHDKIASTYVVKAK